MRDYRQARWRLGEDFLEPLVFEMKGGGGSYKFRIEEGILDYLGVSDPWQLIPPDLRRDEVGLPSLTEPRVARHFVRLSQMNYGVESGPYWLGSCTMKYNPKISEKIASLPQVSRIHPYQPESTVQGALKIMFELSEMLAEITGLPHFSLQPAAGAHGEFLGALIIRRHLEELGEGRRDEMLIPVSAHGSNFASAAMAGFKVVKIPADGRGRIDLGALRAAAGERTAGLMTTNPNTLGLFEDGILEVAEVVHSAGGLLYYDGANLNAILGRVLLSSMGVDVAHLNLHKTFSTPHGTGGPGAGAVGVREGLQDYLPVPVVRREGDRYVLDYSVPKTVGRIRSFYGNFAVLVKAWAYLKMLGSEGLRTVSGVAVLNANYAKSRLEGLPGVEVPYGRGEPCKHEFVLSLEPLKRETGVRALDVAKRLMDYGVHPPTIYFPPIVREAFMMEPTESDGLDEIEDYVRAMEEILEEAAENPESVKSAPSRTAIGRLDEALATKRPILSWRMYENKRREEEGRGPG